MKIRLAHWNILALCFVSLGDEVLFTVNDVIVTDRFKAVRPVLKPSGRFQSRPCQRMYTVHVRTFIVAHAAPGL